MRMSAMVVLRVVALGNRPCLGRFCRYVMVVKLKKTLNEKHDHESHQDPCGCSINAVKLMPSVRQQMEKSDSQHQSGDEAGRHLQARVRQAHPKGDPSARERRQENERAIDRDLSAR